MEDQVKLKERIKELECLYEVSTLISKASDFDQVLPTLCEILEKAFQYPDLVQASITLDSKNYGSLDIIDDRNQIRQEILFQEEVIGYIRVGFKNTAKRQASFLIEEKKLLTKISQEVSFLFERRKRLEKEDELTQIVNRQERLTVLGEMTAGIAHELNTPLGNVIGFSEFILSNSKDKVVVDDAKKVKQSALHAREIVKKLMFFSCEIPQNLNSTELRPLVEEALDLLTPLIKEREVEISFRNEAEGKFALIDKIQFIQVIFNLLNNAIQASPTGGKVEVKLSEKNNFITLMIQDFGKGIPAEIQGKIFDPFFTYGKKGQGNGLGLSVVHGIIKKHKGRIQFSSEKNQGTSFVVSIPKLP